MVAWSYFVMPSQEELQRQRMEQARQDSIAAQDTTSDRQQTADRQTRQSQTDTRDRRQTAQDQQAQQSQQTLQSDKEQLPDMGIFGNTGVTDTTGFVVETPNYLAEFTNLGGGPSQITLKDYQTWDGQPVQLIGDTTKSAYSLGFLSTENYNVETQHILFEQETPGNSMVVREGETRELKYALELENGQRIQYIYTFFGDTYEFDLEIRFVGVQDRVVGGNVDLTWNPRLKFTEKDRTQEAYGTSSYFYAGGELEQFKLDEAGTDENSINGDVSWVATRTKFFTQIMKSQQPTDGALLTGQLSGSPDKASTIHHYSSALRTDIPDDGSLQFRMFTGPLRYYDLVKYDDNVYEMVDAGWIPWFSDVLVQYAIIPFLVWMGNLIGNYGWAIVIFAVLVKVVLYPLTKKSFESMAAMRELQPEMKAIQEKYKDNPQKLQKETMKLYKDAGANPMGACLPNLLQFPILITLWRFFQNSIEIRQKSFMWASDLSAPDVVLSLPFEIPFLGDHLAGFVLLMTASMVVQTQLTGGMTGGGSSGGPNMKAFQYILPIILLFVFNNFAAGLSLYYLIYNSLSIGQQLLINKNIDHEKIMGSIDKKKAKQMKNK